LGRDNIDLVGQFLFGGGNDGVRTVEVDAAFAFLDAAIDAVKGDGARLDEELAVGVDEAGEFRMANGGEVNGTL
jgi:hypothetical protein